MKTLTLDLPRMYGDHHVVEVRRILLELTGVGNVDASSGFRAVRVEYDPEALSEEQITARLDEAGYLGELTVPAEAGVAAYQSGSIDPFLRHTAVYEQTRQVVGFAQNVSYTGRPLWPCPGMGVVKQTEEN